MCEPNIDAEITLLAKSFVYDKSSNTYSIKLSNATLISHDINKKTITFKISPKKIHKSCQTVQIKDLSDVLDDAQMDYLLDEIEMDNEHHARKDSESNSKSSSCHTILSEIVSEWNLNFNNKYHIQICDGNLKCCNCESHQRIQFILHYYLKWINYKCLSNSSPNSPSISSTPEISADSTPESTPSPGQVSMSKTKISQVMNYFNWISDFFYELTNYSSYNLENDFIHILKYHIQSCSEKKTETINYFEKKLNCNNNNCKCSIRHNRDINLDNIRKHKIKENYFIDYQHVSERKSIEFKINQEINLQCILDKIHVCLCHDKHNLLTHTNNSFKYITKLESNNDNNDIILQKNTFGSSITYWDSKHHRYCKPKYCAGLKEELLENNIYSLSLEMYEIFKFKAIHFKNTKYGKSLCALREHDWMKKAYKILIGSQITFDHILALYCYCNIPCLQKAYKQYAYKRDTNHSSIWHYSRLLLECVHCYGVPMNKNKKYYHGINNKLIFDRYNIMIDIPISVTSNKKISYSFSDISGVTVEFSHGGLSDLQSLSFDLSYLTDNPCMGTEYLLFHTYISIKDVVIKRLHHDQWLKILRFWHKVNEGFFHKHLINNELISRNDQLCICAMINNMINMDNNNNNNNNKKYDERIPKYMQKLFNVLGRNGFLWIIESEYELFIPKLKKYLLDNNSLFLNYLTKYKYITVRNVQIFNWYINSIDTNQLFLESNPWIKSDKYKIYLFKNNKNDYLMFHFEAQSKKQSNLFRCRIHLDYKPSYIKSISFGNGLFIQKLQFDNYSYGELNTRKLYNMSLHSLFKTKLLKDINAIQTGFNVKFQIKLFSVKNNKGSIIAIDPHQLY